jgi:hypothetical protein
VHVLRVGDSLASVQPTELSRTYHELAIISGGESVCCKIVHGLTDGDIETTMMNLMGHRHLRRSLPLTLKSGWV